MVGQRRRGPSPPRARLHSAAQGLRSGAGVGRDVDDLIGTDHELPQRDPGLGGHLEYGHPNAAAEGADGHSWRLRVG